MISLMKIQGTLISDYMTIVFNLFESKLKPKALGTSFSILQDEDMFHLAKKYLSATNMPIQQIFYKVVHLKLSTLRHAFTRLICDSQFINEYFTSHTIHKGCINA